MLIKISRSGGFAGIEEKLGSIDTQDLEGPSVENVKLWLTDLNEEQLGADGADTYRYEIAIEDDAGDEHTLVIGGGGDPGAPSPDALRELCELASMS